jgi:hypothetical protein
MQPFEAFYSLQETSQLVFPDGSHQYCDSSVYDCFGTIPPKYHWNTLVFWPIKPSTDGYPFWPIPFAIKDLSPNYKNVYGDLRLPVTMVTNSYQISVLLNYSIDGVNIPLIGTCLRYLENDITDPSAVNELKILFGGKIMGADKLPVQFFKPVGASQVTLSSCSHENLLSKIELIDTIISQLGVTYGSTQIYSLSFQLDSVKYLDGWYSCQNLLNEMLVFSTDVTRIDSKKCHQVGGTEGNKNFQRKIIFPQTNSITTNSHKNFLLPSTPGNIFPHSKYFPQQIHIKFSPRHGNIFFQLIKHRIC